MSKASEVLNKLISGDTLKDIARRPVKMKGLYVQRGGERGRVTNTSKSGGYVTVTLSTGKKVDLLPKELDSWKVIRKADYITYGSD